MKRVFKGVVNLNGIRPSLRVVRGTHNFVKTSIPSGYQAGPKSRRYDIKKASVATGATAFTALLSYFLFDQSEGDISASELRKHNTVHDCWIALNGEVYDVTAFLQMHPGGVARLMEVAGGDATEKFYQIHSDSVFEKMKNNLIYIGKLKGSIDKTYTDEELRIIEMKQKIPPLSTVFSLSDFENVAKHVLPKSTFMYYATGSSDEFSIRENHYAYGRVFFKPKMMQDRTGDLDLSTEFLGTKVDLPFYITAFAGSKLAHPLGEMNLQAASYAANVMHMVPKMNSYSIDEFFEVVPDDQNHWYQYHFDTQEEIDNIEQLVKKVEKMPSVKGFFFNVDLDDIGNREKDSRQRAAETVEPDVLNKLVPADFGEHPYMSWKIIDRILATTDLPVGLKGVQRGEDVVIAAEKGIKAVVLSNHGGRQLDFSRPPLEVLAEARAMLKEKNLEDNIEIYIDGGVRRGSDIIKALCLGAKGVGLGRPFLYAMAGYGEEGVSKLVSILQLEIQNNMRLLGVRKIDDLDESFIDCKNLTLRNPKAGDSLYDEAYQPLIFQEFK